MTIPSHQRGESPTSKIIEMKSLLKQQQNAGVSIRQIINCVDY